MIQVKPMTFKIPNHLNDLLTSEGAIIVVGTGRSGKTVLGHLLASLSPKPKYALSYPKEAIDQCPDDWETISPDDVFSLQDCVIIIDDAALFASSRNFNSTWSKNWVRFQTIISHKGITLIFIIQSTNLLDIGTLRSQRMSILYKHSDLINTLFEREEFKQIASTSRSVIDRLRTKYPSPHPKSWVYDLTLGKGWTHPLPTHWTTSLSTPYKHLTIEVDSK